MILQRFKVDTCIQMVTILMYRFISDSSSFVPTSTCAMQHLFPKFLVQAMNWLCLSTTLNRPSRCSRSKDG